MKHNKIQLYLLYTVGHPLSVNIVLGFQVDVTNRSENVDLTNYVVSGEFDLVNVQQRRRVVQYTCCPEVSEIITCTVYTQ